MAFSANFGGWIADTLVSKGLSVTRVRKVLLIFIIKFENFLCYNYINIYQCKFCKVMAFYCD